MTAIKAHFDGKVFVPDEPVRLQPGEQVVVQTTHEPQRKRSGKADTSFLRKLNINLDAKAVREIIDDPEMNIENF